MSDHTFDDEIEVTPEMIEAGLSAFREDGRRIEDADNRDKRRY